MNRKMRNELKKLYEAPAPMRKREFFREIKPSKISIRHMVWIQISYISKWEWALSAVLFGIIVFTSRFLEIIVFSTALVMMPLLAVVSVSESMRSVTYSMEELEMSARFSLKGIILARMGVMGIENLILALTFSLFIQRGFLCSMLYLLVPYLITVYASLYIIRYVPGREGIFACGGVSAAVSVGMATISQREYEYFFQERYTFVWLSAVLILMYMVIKESRKMMKHIECSI